MKKAFSKVSDVLKESALNDKFGQALDKCMLFSFWKTVAGRKFEKVSTPYDLKGGVLFVSVANSTAAQELSFFKEELIKKYLPYAKGLKFNISDIRFNYKNWGETLNSSSNGAFDRDFYENYTEEDYNSVQLSEEETLEFKRLYEEISKNDFMPEKLRENFYNQILRQHKARKLRLQGR